MTREGYVVAWGGWGSGEWAYINASSPEQAVEIALLLNLYAFRATDPRDLYAAQRDGVDVVGPENDCTLAKVIGGSDLVVCAWGSANTNGRDERVLDLIAAPHAIGLTRTSKPRHPLYVRGDTPPRPFAHCPPEAAWGVAA